MLDKGHLHSKALANIALKQLDLIPMFESNNIFNSYLSKPSLKSLH